MAGSKEQHLDEQHRLLAMREYLGVRSKPEDRSFEADVVEAAARKVQPVIAAHADLTGETIIDAVARELGIRFESVRSTADIQRLERKYLVEQRELGFGRLAQELADPTVDALLFQRLYAAQDDPDRWVAVINLQETQARAYWSRPHEILHRLAEPPQKRLPFFRHRTDHQSRVERIIDLGAAEIAFPRVAFGARVSRVSDSELTWDLVKAVRQQFAPTSSLQSAAKAFLRHWPHPAFLLQATQRGRRGSRSQDVALRIDVDGFTASAEKAGVRFFPNMRVPPSSPIWQAHRTGLNITDRENLKQWVTSGGSSLPDRYALSSGLRMGAFVYGLVSLY